MKWGILGASKFAQDFMGPAIHAAEGAELLAVASRTPEKVTPFQRFAPGCRAFGAYEALLECDEIDAIYIPLPHTLQVDWTLKALNAGKHVLCEKPIAMQGSDFDPLIKAGKRTGLLVAEAYMIAHHPQWAFVQDLLENQTIGTLAHVSGAFSYDNSDDPTNIRNHKDTGGGGLRDIGVYAMGAAQMATGYDLTDITAQIRWHDGYDVFAAVQGRLGQATYGGYVSTRMHLHQAMEFHGTNGLIRLSAPFNPRIFGEARVEVHLHEGQTQTRRFPLADQYKLQVEAFENAVRTGQPFPWSLEQARATQWAIDRILSVATPLT